MWNAASNNSPGRNTENNSCFVRCGGANTRAAPSARSQSRNGTKAPRRARLATAPDRLLRDEALLVARIRSAVSDQEYPLAERLSREYWRRFETGQLNPEVRALDSRRASRNSGK